MRRPRVLLDVDGPLTRGFFDIACRYLRDEGVDARPSRIDRWNIFESFGASDVVERTVRERLCAPGVALEFRANVGSGAFLARLREWADVYAVTAPLDGSPTWTHDRERWLFDRLGFRSDRVIHARDKRLVGGDAFIDDKLQHLVDWRGEHPLGLAILWREPHNSADAGSWRGPAVADYGELVERLDPLRRTS